MSPTRDYLAETLSRFPQLPSFALWRAVELRLLAPLDFPEPILDVGCGDGNFAEMLFGSGRDVTGFDLSVAELRRAAASPAYRQVLHADATQMPFAEGEFASALSNCVLEHIPEDARVLGEVARVLRPGGVFVFTVPAPPLKSCLYTYQALLGRGETEQADNYLAAFDQRLAHFHYRAAEEWTALLTTVGLRPERIEPYLPAPTVAVWDRLENYLTQPVMNVLDHKKLAGLVLMGRALRTRLFHRQLRRYYLLDAVPGQPHGCWLVVARKPEA